MDANDENYELDDDEFFHISAKKRDLKYDDK